MSLSLRRAIDAGSSARVRTAVRRGAQMNVWDTTFNGYPIHGAVRLGNAEVVAALVELGCSLTVIDRDLASPRALAIALGHDQLVAILDAACEQPGPTWLRQAQRDGIAWYRFFFTKGLGFGFDPNDIELPILVGGDYDGFGHHLCATSGRETRERDAERSADFGAATAWFVPFLDKLIAHTDFSLDEVTAAAPHLEVRHTTT